MKINRTKTLIVLNTVFICFALLAIVLNLPLLFPDSPDLLLRDFIVPIASVIILLFAFFQSRKGNEIQSSLIFYNEEYNRIATLLGKFETQGNLRQIKNVINIDFEHDYKLPVINYRIILGELKQNDNVIQIINREPKGKSSNHNAIIDLYDHVREYCGTVERLYESLGRTVNLHRKGYLVEPHKELLFYKLSPVFKPFVSFSDSIKRGEVYNPTLPKGFIGKRTEFDLLEKDSIKQLSDKINALYKQEAYKLEELS